MAERASGWQSLQEKNDVSNPIGLAMFRIGKNLNTPDQLSNVPQRGETCHASLISFQ